MDLQGILGIDNDVRNGFGGIKVTYKLMQMRNAKTLRPSLRNRRSDRRSMIS